MLATGVLLTIAFILSPLGFVFLVMGVFGLVVSGDMPLLSVRSSLRGEDFLGDTFLAPDHPHLDFDTFWLATHRFKRFFVLYPDHHLIGLRAFLQALGLELSFQSMGLELSFQSMGLELFFLVVGLELSFHSMGLKHSFHSVGLKLSSSMFKDPIKSHISLTFVHFIGGISFSRACLSFTATPVHSTYFEKGVRGSFVGCPARIPSLGALEPSKIVS